MSKRHATITAFTVEVSCPHCGEPVEEPSTGSFYWEPRQVAAVGTAPRECNACEETFRIVPQSRVSIPATLSGDERRAELDRLSDAADAVSL